MTEYCRNNFTVSQYFVSQQKHKTSERRNYSTLSRRFESIYSAMKPRASSLMQIPDYMCYKLYANHHKEYVLFHFLTSFVLFLQVGEIKGNEKLRSLEILERLKQIKHAIIWQLLRAIIIFYL